MSETKADRRDLFSYKPIGFLKSIFPTKNGTPRQSGLSEYARASLTISKEVFTNPEHSLHDLSSFSHVWLVWVFHQNTVGSAVKAKVAPPRLGGERVGVFSTRSPHRPANLGLTLARLEAVKEDTLHLTGVDIVDGTPVLDIKPYIPQYDSPQPASSKSPSQDPCLSPCQADDPLDPSSTGGPGVSCPAWVGNPTDNLRVIFTSRAEAQLAKIDITRCEWLRSQAELKEAIRDILAEDPRSVYRKDKCSDRMYFTSIDGVHVTAWFDPDIGGMEVVKIRQQVSGISV